MAYKFFTGALYNATGSLSASGVITGKSFAGDGSSLSGIVANPMGEALSMGDYSITNVNDIALDSISADDGSSFSFGSNWTAASRTCANLGTVTTVDIDGGTLGGITIDGNWTAASQTCANLGTVTTCDIDGGSIDGTTIGANSAGAGTFAAIVGTSLSLTEGDITNAGAIECDSISDDNAALDIDFSGCTTTNAEITIGASLADALSITDGSNDWMVFSTSTSALTIGYNEIDINLEGVASFDAGYKRNHKQTGSAGTVLVGNTVVINAGDSFIQVNNGSTACTVELPYNADTGTDGAKLGWADGRIITIKRATGMSAAVEISGAVGADPDGGNFFDGSLDILSLDSAGASVTLIGSGSAGNTTAKWLIF